MSAIAAPTPNRALGIGIIEVSCRGIFVTSSAVIIVLITFYVVAIYRLGLQLFTTQAQWESEILW